MHKTIKKLYIANRGEIARRIAFAAKCIGIESVTISERAVPPRYLTEVISQFVYLNEVSTKDYLDIELQINLAKDAGCDAIHPGFGFLSENAGFASACEKAGLLWIGPNPQAIDAMASKAAARDLAVAAKVPCNIGLQGIDPSVKNFNLGELTKKADAIGYPLLVKAALGGGGKGMRIVNASSELGQALQRCHSEAMTSFKDGALIIEKYLTAPRHVEVQILGDKHGNVVAIGDRDCSVQRRHQKIIEEAPAPALQDRVRQEMHTAAVNLAKRVGYDSAGTVEFMVETKGKDQSFYFLEMNTRLQVEHPVTEEVFGIDLVRAQINSALGEKLPAHFHDLKPRGHSIEVRLYAEDPENNFFPSPGCIYQFVPATGAGIRWEFGIDTCDEISNKFDPMVAKCVAFAEDRESAARKLALALTQTCLIGPANNLSYLAAALVNKRFLAVDYGTNFIALEHAGLIAAINHKKTALAPVAKQVMQVLRGLGKAQAPTPGQQGFKDFIKQRFSKEGSIIAAMTTKSKHQLIDYQSATLNKIPVNYGSILTETEAYARFALVKSTNANEYWCNIAGFNFQEQDATGSTLTSVGGVGDAKDIKAPMPGKVLAIKIKSGDQIEKNTVVVILESMKMEYEVKAATPGKVTKINVKEGEQAKAGQVLVAIDHL